MSTKGRREEGEGTAEDAVAPEISAGGMSIVRSSSHPPRSEPPLPVLDASGVHNRPLSPTSEPALRFRRDTPRVRPGARSSRPPGPLPQGAVRSAPGLAPEVALAIAAAAADSEGATDEVTRRTRRPQPPAASSRNASMLLKAIVVLALSLLVAVWLSR